jgi:hypothetical protein
MLRVGPVPNSPSAYAFGFTQRDAESIARRLDMDRAR